MLIDTPQARLPLAAGHVAHLQHAQCSRVTVLHGLAWLTIDNDLRDIVLAEGESFVIDSDAKVLVYPLRHAQALELEIDSRAATPAYRRAAAMKVAVV
ncbi:MAG TPA: DUF2917 domain-containing protein [Rubrivivax sp.]